MRSELLRDWLYAIGCVTVVCAVAELDGVSCPIDEAAWLRGEWLGVFLELEGAEFCLDDGCDCVVRLRAVISGGSDQLTSQVFLLA